VTIEDFADGFDVRLSCAAIDFNRQPLAASLKDFERYFGKVVSHDALKAVA
jgi:hypothetical protein